MEYFILKAGWKTPRRVTFREAQKIMGSIRMGKTSCSDGCCYGVYDNLAQFVAIAKEHGHRAIYCDPEGPSVYAE